ncbi:extracellular solute-binding protein [Paenibacillus sp. BC26]|uniref:extracellular solute-binding protein n=1 Tax=Paenibacillus sp. BC26 TaxID=1881032 RepID=UPI0008EBA9FD|nr:extracellular solute-binding protein [Paenibacillus sp. BC26]SFT24282.1 carbohydrate ABC transporter substrate-binding protein, CUT1 family [Paenibacillus sp. BC26]
MKRKRIATSLGVMLLSTSMLMAGCASKSETNNNNDSATATTNTNNQAEATTNTPEAAPAFEFGVTPVSFSFYGNYDWYTQNPWGADPGTKWIQDNKKVTVTAVQAGSSPEVKLNAMIASDELPDVIWGERDANVEKLRAAGKLVALDQYVDKYPNLKKWAGDATLNMLKAEDGHLYVFPNWYANSARGNGGYIVNTKIYTELGSPKLETFDDLYAYLKLVKEKYPKVIPFETSIGAQGIYELYSGFAEDHPVQFVSQMAVPNGDKLESIFTDPTFKETLQYASKLFREKLVTQDALTQKIEQVREKVTTGKVAVAAAYNVTDLGARGTVALKAADPSAGYTMIWPLQKGGLDKNKIFATQYDSLGWNVNMITTSAKDPEGIFAYLDWLTGPEGQRVGFWGPPGLYWDGADDTDAPKFTDKYASDKEGLSKMMSTMDSFNWAGNTTFIDQAKSKHELSLPADQQEWATIAQNAVAWKTAYNITQFANMDPAPTSEEGVIAQRISDIFTRVFAKAIFAKDDAEVEAMLNTASEEANSAGYDKLLTFKTAKWQDNLKRINAQ